ncbi:MAG: hypothetical protein FJ088_16340, partial [Deltaproteobacteria bacterium]|nr:hypothetical protein [Deltaproteobacteria bacterium]
GVLERFASAAGATGRHEEAAEALERFVGVLEERDSESVTLDDISAENRIAIKLAGIYDEKLKRRDLAIKCYEKVLPFEMENLELLKDMERLYEAQGMHEPLVGICLREAELSWEIESRKSLLLKAASIQEDILNNRGEAIINYKQALSLDETDAAVYGKLQSAYEKEGLWEELKNLLIKKTSLYSGDKDVSDAEFKIGSVYRDRLGDGRSAAAYFLRAFRRSRENSAALEALEEILFSETGRAADIGKDIVSFLEKYYEERSDYLKLLSIYRIQKEMLRDPAAVRDMNLKIAGLLESKINDRKGAFITLCEAVSENPQDANLIARAEEVAGELGMVREFAECLLDASHNHPITVEMALLT